MPLRLPPLPSPLLWCEASLLWLAGLQSRRMRHLYSKSRSLKRLMSAAIGRRSREEESTEEIASPVKSTWRCFSYEEIHAATDGFHKGYAVVFRGVMADGQAIAVKTMVGASTDEQREKDFLTELGTVGHVRHPNVSALLGCCIDRGLHLVFEFSSRGSVSSNLHGKAPTRTLRR
ncbi:hypothetical protein GW17_00016128 [Ensete ventricosum]|nr:hypothetical protein GW17_00016128 [Ensete ventricosum]RZS10904.1 hypothetical protein BHM03_00042181 [Ensete ventricosum]